MRVRVPSATPPTLQALVAQTDRAPSFYLGTMRVRVLPRAPQNAKRRVGRAERHRTANAARPSGRAGSTPVPSTNAGKQDHPWRLDIATNPTRLSSTACEIPAALVGARDRVRHGVACAMLRSIDWRRRTKRAPRNATRGALQVAPSGGVRAAQSSPLTKHATRRAVPQLVSTQPYRLLSGHLSQPVSKWRSTYWKGHEGC